MSTAKAKSAPLIKGYLPVRLRLSQRIDKLEDEAFFYVKEHQDSTDTTTTVEGGKQKSASKTLFVCNTPAVPNIRTGLLLKSLFGRFGEVARVTVVPNPRKEREEDNCDSSSLVSWTSKYHSPSFLPPPVTEGKFAHVVFESNKEMRKTLKELNRIMMAKPVGVELPGLSLDAIEIQTLGDETDRQIREEQKSDDSDDSESSDDEHTSMKGIMAVVNRYRSSCLRLDRRTLLHECNTVIQEFEEEEELARKSRDASMSEADENGFVTVSYSAQVASKSELEATNAGTSASRRGKGQMRHRKKKDLTGSSELSDFYRFQTKENRKRSVHALRERFEKDLAKVKKMKEDGQYRPF